MKTHIVQCSFVAMLAGLLCCACGRNSSKAPAALSEEEIPAAFSQAFKNADKETHEAADHYVADVKGHDLSAAFNDIQELFHTPNLTDEQKVVVAGALRTTSKKLQDAAASGDANAAQTLKSFGSSR